MKKLFFTVVLSCFVMASFAQKKVLRNANKAFKKDDYATATQLANEASNHPDTQDNPDVYVLLGKIQMAQFDNGGRTDAALAVAAYEQFLIAMEKGGDKLTAQMMEPPVMAVLPGQEEATQTGGSETMALLERWLIEAGNEAYNNNDFEQSYAFISLANKIRYSDELAVFGGYVAQMSDNTDGMIEQYTMIMNSTSDTLPENANFAFYGLAKYHYDNKDWEAAIETVNKSKERLGFDSDMANLELQVYLDSDRMDEAIANLNARIDQEPNEVLNVVTLANVYWFVEDNENAAATAQRALDMDANNYDANYILGGAIYGQAAELNKKAGDPSLDDETYEKTKQGAKDKFTEALPYFEKCYSMKPDDTKLYAPMTTIYDQLGMAEKRDEMMAKMDGN